MIPGLPAQFLNWRLKGDTKLPCKPDGTICDAHDPVNHVDYATASAAPYGVAFALRADDPWWFLDLDKCHDGTDWSEEAKRIVNYFPGAWIEVSQSGRGLHIMGKCDPSQLADRRNKWDGWIECYTKERFIAFGPHGWSPIGGTATDKDWTRELLSFVPQREFLGELPDGVDPAYTGPDDDDALIAAMLRSSSAASAFGDSASVRDLWEANVTILSKQYPAYDDDQDFDHSSADAALMSHLAFWTGKDMPRMDRLFRRSALMRDKFEKRADYRRDTIQNAARLCKRVYDRPRPTPSEAPSLEMYLTIPEMIEHFKGCVYVREGHRILMPDGSLLKPEQFRAVYGGHLFQMQPDGAGHTKNAFEAFTENRAHRFPKARRAVFYPDRAYQEMIGEDVNVYVPAKVRKVQGDIGPFMDFLSRLMPNEIERRILMSWMQWVVQHPGKKRLWAPVVQGSEGNGKSLISEVMTYAVGSDYTHVTKASQLTSQFNGWQAGKLFISVPEFHMGSKREVLDEMKPWITDMMIPVRHMQQAEVNTHVPTNWLCTTNHKDAVIKSKADRRYAVIFTGQQSRADVERDFPGDYFQRLWDWLRDEDGFARLAWYLHNAPIDPEYGDNCVRAPWTPSTDEAMEATVGGIEAEILEAVDSEAQGFRGNWVSSWAVDKLLRDRGLRIGRPRVAAILQDLGYVKWGRAPRAVISEDRKRPELWTKGSLDAAFDIYLEAQSHGGGSAYM